MTLSGRVLSHYQVQSLLGAGGMGEVYLARDPRLDRAVALKILPPDLAFDVDRMQRFTLEAKAASALNHPNVATIHDVGDSDGVRFIVMEYVEGQTLAEKIVSGPLSAAAIVDIGLQVADALEAAHAKGITHRDIKPANLMLTPRGAARLWGAMFGLLDSMASPLQASIKMMIGDRYIDRAKEALGADAFEQALSEGRAMSLQQAIQYAVADGSGP